ncbi:MAG: hypothetical protein KDD53_12580, partial [Bdellovibrionales bacterium]|nr:hypothetical protein [Bdellovibrionales bacterium]
MQSELPKWGVLDLFSFGKVLVRVHVSLILFLVGTGAICLFSGMSQVESLLLASLILSSVFIHEACHIVTAFYIGIRPLETVIFPFGGILRFEKSPSVRDATLVMLAGPVCSLFLFLAFLLDASPEFLTAIVNLEIRHATSLLGPHSIREYLSLWNLAIFTLNLIPIYPFDAYFAFETIRRANSNDKDVGSMLRYLQIVT